ncbi:MAG: type I restriction enzyme HsdR N-terminal domain-containing protein [Bacteroidota bacterium]
MDLIFPDYPLKIEHRDGTPQIWGIIRRKWLVLQKEEYVRQLLIHYLIEAKGYPKGLMSVEKEVRYLDSRRRFDVVVYDKHGQPWMLCECKSPDIALHESVFFQIARYNHTLQAPYLLITNGSGCWVFERNEAGKFEWLRDWME